MRAPAREGGHGGFFRRGWTAACCWPRPAGAAGSGETAAEEGGRSGAGAAGSGEDAEERTVYAATVRTSLHPLQDAAVAERVAGELGAGYLEIAVDELKEAGIEDNPLDRCYRCKKLLFSRLKEEAERAWRVRHSGRKQRGRHSGVPSRHPGR